MRVVRFVQVPGIPRNAPATFLSGSAGRLHQCSQHFGRGTLILKCVVEHGGIAIEVGAAGDALDLGAVGSQRHQRGIAADLELVAPALRAGVIAVQVNGDEQSGLGLEFRLRKDGGLEQVTGRTPHRAPIQQHRQVLGLGRRQGRGDVAVEPGDAWRPCSPRLGSSGASAASRRAQPAWPPKVQAVVCRSWPMPAVQAATWRRGRCSWRQI